MGDDPIFYPFFKPSISFHHGFYSFNDAADSAVLFNAKLFTRLFQSVISQTPHQVDGNIPGFIKNLSPRYIQVIFVDIICPAYMGFDFINIRRKPFGFRDFLKVL